MSTGLQIATIIIIVAGFAMVIVYQRWKRTSQTQTDIDNRFQEDEEKDDQQ